MEIIGIVVAAHGDASRVDASKRSRKLLWRQHVVDNTFSSPSKIAIHLKVIRTLTSWIRVNNSAITCIPSNLKEARLS